MKKIISAIIAIAMACATLPVYAYSPSDYHAKVTELRTLINECKALGINTQQEEIDANIIEAYADRIQEFQTNGMSSSVTNFQLTELDTLYSNAKANLEAYKSEQKTAPAKAYTYETGDGYDISGASLENKYGNPYFSSGIGHFSLSEHMKELSGYGFDNVQLVTGLGDVVTNDRLIDGWDTAISGGANVTFEMVTNRGNSNNTSLRIVNTTPKADNVYGTIFQRIPVKPNTTYEISFNLQGTSEEDYAASYSVDDFHDATMTPRKVNVPESGTWKKLGKTFTTGPDEYYKGLRFVFSKPCEYYLDDIKITKIGSNKNLVNNGGFDGDGTDDFDIFFNTDTSLMGLFEALDNAEKNDIHVEVLLELHQSMPKNILDKYPEVGKDGGRYDVNHPVAQAVEKAYIESVLGTISEYKSLGSIIVTNEPDYTSWDYLNISGASAKKIDYNVKFREYLQNKHGTISALNSAWGTSYSDFSKISCPTSVGANAQFYEWKNFNDEIFTNWYAKTVQIIKNCIPGIPVSVKAQSDFGDYDSDTKREFLSFGVDMDLLGEISDFHGNDSYGYIEDPEQSLANALKWYDYLNSISDKPIFDSEKHITKDGSTTYSTKANTFIGNATWQSYIHGLDMYSIWRWELDVAKSSDSGYGHLAMRPGAISEVAKATLNANRWSTAVTALANSAPSVAILRSDTSRIYNTQYMHALTYAYNAANEAGYKVGFVTHRNIEETLSSYDTLIIPYTKNVEANVVNAIAGFNGKLIIIGSDSLTKNEYNQNYTGTMKTKVDQIHAKADATSTRLNATGGGYRLYSPTKSTIKDKLVDNSGIVVASSNGSTYDNLVWSSVPYQNGYLVNISNYDDSSWSTRNVVIKKNGQTFSHITSLLEDKDVTNISMPAMTSGLYYVRNIDDDILEDEVPEEDDAIIAANNEIVKLDVLRGDTTDLLVWESKAAGTYNVYRVNADGKLTFLGSTEDEQYVITDVSGVRTYAVKCLVGEGKESQGKKITSGFDVNAAITVTTSKNPQNKISVNYTNTNNYCIAATITATSYNTDGTFGSGVVLEVLVPAGKTISYEKALIGSGDVVIKKK